MAEEKTSTISASKTSKKRATPRTDSTGELGNKNTDHLAALWMVHDEAKKICDYEKDTETQYLVPSMKGIHNAIKNLRKSYPTGKLPYPAAGYWKRLHRFGKQKDDECYIYAAELMEWAASEIRGGKAVHSDDFRWVRWCGIEYEFSPLQAKVVSVLWAHWEEGRGKVHQGTLLKAATSFQGRLYDLFAKGRHPAWHTMIVTDGKGLFWLGDPLDELDE